jgi:hypothetical protein
MLGQSQPVLEVVAFDHDTVRRLFPFDLLKPRHRPACDLGDPESSRSRVLRSGRADVGAGRRSAARSSPLRLPA